MTRLLAQSWRTFATAWEMIFRVLDIGGAFLLLRIVVLWNLAPITQLDRVPGYELGSRGFESSSARFSFWCSPFCASGASVLR